MGPMKEGIPLDANITKLLKYWRALPGGCTLDDEQISSVLTFLRILPAEEIMEAMDAAGRKVGGDKCVGRFRYFCGICHNKIDDKTGNKYRRVLKLFAEMQEYFLSKGRGSGWHNEDELLELCQRYPRHVLINAIDLACARGRESDWRAVVDAVEKITGDNIDFG